MVEKGINAMIIKALAGLCEQKCREFENCDSMCVDAQYLLDMVVKYPIQTFDTTTRNKK